MHVCLEGLSVPQGAERVLRLPGELSRFQQLPLRVEYEQGNGK